jgi:hypothetical protein
VPGTPSPATFVATTFTENAPLRLAGRKTLSTLLRGSAFPFVLEVLPLSTLPR